MELILPRRIPSKKWIQDAVYSHYTGMGSRVAIVVDDEDEDNVVVVVGLPDHTNAQGAIALSRFVISAENAASKDELERIIHKAAKKASDSLRQQIFAEESKHMRQVN